MENIGKGETSNCNDNKKSPSSWLRYVFFFLLIILVLLLIVNKRKKKLCGSLDYSCSFDETIDMKKSEFIYTQKKIGIDKLCPR